MILTIQCKLKTKNIISLGKQGSYGKFKLFLNTYTKFIQTKINNMS